MLHVSKRELRRKPKARVGVSTLGTVKEMRRLLPSEIFRRKLSCLFGIQHCHRDIHNHVLSGYRI
jgi:hypothetical protein